MYSRILFSLFSYNFIITYISCNLFKYVLKKIDDTKKKNDRIVFDEKIVQKEDFEPFAK